MLNLVVNYANKHSARVSNNLIDEKEWNLVIEVAQQIGSKRVRCIAMDTTDGIKKEVQRF